MSRSSRARFADAVRAPEVDLALACLLVGAEVDPDLDPAPFLAQLDALAAAVPRDVPAEVGLRSVLAGFTGDAHDYGDLRSSLLHEVLQRRAGLPILLSVVWLEVARRCGVRAEGVGLPGHFVVRVEGQLVDPFAGGAPLDARGVPASDLRPWSATAVLLRILTNVRVWAGQGSERSAAARWALELSLLLPQAPLVLRSDLGALLVASGHFLTGAAELEEFAAAATDPSAAERARAQAAAARARLN